jgi:hypothetical protein
MTSSYRCGWSRREARDEEIGRHPLGSGDAGGGGIGNVERQAIVYIRSHDRNAISSLEGVAMTPACWRRASRQTVAEQKRPEQDVIAWPTRSSEAGLGERHFGGLRPESDSAVPGSAHRRQTLRITLRQQGLPELGAFLERWAASHELWTPTRVELSRAQTQADPGRYDVSILIAATYIAQP